MTVEERLKEYIEATNKASLENAMRINAAAQVQTKVAIDIHTFETALMPVLVAWCIKGDGEHFQIWLNLLGDQRGEMLHSTIDVMKDGKLAFVVPPPYNELDIPPPDRASDIAVAVTTSMVKLGPMIDNGETRAIMQEDHKIEEALSSNPNNKVFLRNAVLLAKIWKYYDLDVKMVLGERMSELIDLDQFDIRGEWIGGSVAKEAPQLNKGQSQDYGNDAEYEI